VKETIHGFRCLFFGVIVPIQPHTQNISTPRSVFL